MNPVEDASPGKLPIGVLLPTVNSMELLGSHVATMKCWLDLVEEVVVVDSESRDGSSEFLKAALAGTNVRFFDHPRGLYQSWNFGISQIRSRYTYISTVADGISRAGFCQLATLARQFDCDLVLSKPDFVDDRGQAVPAHTWPVDHLIEGLRITAPVCLEGWVAFLFAFVHSPNALLGSSASNLYRTTCLQERPFPTDYGTVGDGAWGLKHAAEIRIGVTPERFSFFREHRKTYDTSDYQVAELPAKLHRLGIQSFDSMLQRTPRLRRRAEELQLSDLIRAVEQWHQWQRELNRQRREFKPWVLNPAAWRARVCRNKFERESLERLRRVLQTLTGIQNSHEA